MKRENVYAKVDEKYVKTVVLYANSSKALFYDKAAKTDKVKEAELKELFLKGVAVVYNNDHYKPVCLKAEGLISYNGTEAVTFTAE